MDPMGINTQSAESAQPPLASRGVTHYRINNKKEMYIIKTLYKPGYFIKPSDVAKILNVSLSSVYKLIKDRKLKAVLVGRTKRIYYPELCIYIESHVNN